MNDVRTAEGNRAARIAGTGILFALLLFICAGAHAAEWKLTASCPSRGNETVCSWTTAGVTTLCVPGFWDLSAVTLEVEGQEKIYLGPDRLEIKAGEPADLRGMTDRQLSIYIKEPTYPSTAQVEYLGRTVTELQHALMAKDGICPESGKHYTDYLDMESFALKYLIENWCKNYDYMAGSQYFYKDSDRIDPKIYAGPAWDYDLSFGNMEDRGILTTAGYLNNIKQDNNIYWLLYTHEEFRELVAERWRSVFRPAVGVLLGETPPREDGTLRSFEDYREGIRASAAMNYRKWGKNSATSKISGEFFSTATPYLENWIRKHTAAMDEMYGYPAETE